MRKSGAYGPALATLGAAGLVVSLWRTWYTAHVAQSAWQTFTTTPVVLLAIALLGGGLSALELTDRVGDTSRLAMLTGAVAAVLVGYRIVTPPGPGLVHVTSGAYVALASALALVSGGLLAAVGRAGGLPELSVPALSLEQAATAGAVTPPPHAVGSTAHPVT